MDRVFTPVAGEGVILQNFCKNVAPRVGWENVRVLGERFSECLEYPLSLDSLAKFLHTSGINLEMLPPAVKGPRGFNFIYGQESACIFYREDDAPCGKIHTILHELYEIMLHRSLSPSYLAGLDHDEVESLADGFASQVHLPRRVIIPWVNAEGLDIINCMRSMTCSYTTAGCRMNDMLNENINKATGFLTPHIGLLYERPYWKMSGFEAPPFERKFFTKTESFNYFIPERKLFDIVFSYPNCPPFAISTILDCFSDTGEGTFFPSIEMRFQEKVFVVDILIRTVHWKKRRFPRTAKVLIQIVPSYDQNLKYLAKKLGMWGPQIERNHS